jgi:hypothetical protein
MKKPRFEFTISKSAANPPQAKYSEIKALKATGKFETMS